MNTGSYNIDEALGRYFYKRQNRNILNMQPIGKPGGQLTRTVGKPAGTVAGSVGGTNKAEKSLVELVQEDNKRLKRQTDALNMFKVLDSAGSLISNLTTRDGDAPIENIRMIAPEMQYDDSVRRRIMQDAMKQSQIAQSNAMKLGLGAMIPQIDSNVRGSLNELAKQSQEQANQVAQKNAMIGADIANKEQEVFAIQREKIIQDAIMKNAARYQAVGQSKEALFGDLSNLIAQKQAFRQEDIKSKVFDYLIKNPKMTTDDAIRIVSSLGINPKTFLEEKNRGKASEQQEIEIGGVRYSLTEKR